MEAFALLAAALGILCAAAWIFRALRASGRREGEGEQYKRMVDDAQTAKDIRARLVLDGDFARRVRKAFTRP